MNDQVNSQPKESINLTYIVYKGRKSLFAKDVADYIRACGSGEETDVRRRLNEAAANLEK